MILADVNVLVSAYRPDAPAHAPCRTWLEQTIEAEAPFGLSPLVLAAVVRIATHPRIFEPPSEQADVIGYCEDILNQPHARIIAPGARHWEIFCRLLRRTGACGNLVSDAWYAALAIEQDCTWVTLDRDFARFPGLRWRLLS